MAPTSTVKSARVATHVVTHYGSPKRKTYMWISLLYFVLLLHKGPAATGLAAYADVETSQHKQYRTSEEHAAAHGKNSVSHRHLEAVNGHAEALSLRQYELGQEITGPEVWQHENTAGTVLFKKTRCNNMK